MSSTRVVLSSAVMVLALCLVVWVVTDAFPLIGVVAAQEAPTSTGPRESSPQTTGTQTRLRFSRDRGIELVEGPLTWPASAVRIGGALRVPTKVTDVRPVYPPEAQTARVQGVVIIEALLGTDGRVDEASVLRSIPLLDRAALDAVSQWEFTPTLLNGQPTAVLMTMTVRFSLD
jgi:protein TonB